MDEEKKPAAIFGRCDVCHRLSGLRDGLCGNCEMDDDVQGLMDRDMGDN